MLLAQNSSVPHDLSIRIYSCTFYENHHGLDPIILRQTHPSPTSELTLAHALMLDALAVFPAHLYETPTTIDCPGPLGQLPSRAHQMSLGRSVVL
jgi:hypothetical protein